MLITIIEILFTLGGVAVVVILVDAATYRDNDDKPERGAWS